MVKEISPCNKNDIIALNMRKQYRKDYSHSNTNRQGANYNGMRLNCMMLMVSHAQCSQ